MTRRPFAIYKHNQRIDEKELWHLHRKYQSMDQAKQAFGDLIRRPRKDRVWVYVILPTVHDTARAIILKEDVLQLAK